MSLIDKLRKGREFKVEAGGWKFTAMRPTDMDMFRLMGKEGYSLLSFVCGWEMSEIDLGIPGGSGDPVPFDADLFAEWIKDQPHLWEPMIGAIKNAYARHAEKRDLAEKN